MSDLATLIRKAMDGRLRDVHTGIPGVVVRYDTDSQRAAVQPLVQRVFTDEKGERQAVPLPVVTDVPVIFPGADVRLIGWDVRKGDSVWLMFAEASMDRLLASGSSRAVDPGDPRRHALSDAVAIPGFLVEAEDGNPLIWFSRTPAELRLGGAGATQGVPLGNSMVSAIETLVTAIAAAISLNISSGGSGAATAINTAKDAFVNAASAYLSGKVKVE